MPTPDLPSPAAFPYATHLNVLFDPLEKFSLDPLVAAVRDTWYNQTLARVILMVETSGVVPTGS